LAQGPPPPTGSPWPPPATGTSPLAFAAIACSIAGLFILPIIGGILGAGLGVAALADMRRSGRTQNRGLAITATVIGLVVGVLPLAVWTVLERQHWTSVPFGLTISYGSAIVVLLWRETAGRERAATAAGLAGGIVMIAAAAVLGYLFALLFIHAVIWLLRDAFRAVGCSIGKSVHSSSYRCKRK
jgi:hypothetical protein